MLADAVVDALTQQPRWLDKALALLAPRADAPLRLPRPRIGTPPAAAMLTAMGDRHQDTNGPQRVNLAGLDSRFSDSGSRSRKRPNISHVGRASLRPWLSHYALRLGAQAAHLQSDDARRKHPSPGKGSGQRALRAVCDKVSRRIDRSLLDHAPASPTKDQTIAR
jgi:Transposase IS116/IS110/IS902 family